MEGLFINPSKADLSLKEVFKQFIREKECANLSDDSIKYYKRCFTSFRQVSKC